MKYLSISLRALMIIGFILLSISAFMYLYDEVGFSWKANVLFAWGYSIVGYVFVTGLIILLLWEPLTSILEET